MMQTVHFPALGEEYFQKTLKNGLHLRVIPKPGFAKKYAFLALNYGAIDTDFRLSGENHMTPDGVAHFLEHKMFDMPYGDAMSRFADLGGSPNAFTSHTMTAYYVECTEKLEENLQTLLEFVFTPYFTQKSVDKEQGIIAQEIRMYRDSADSQVYDNLFSAMYAHHPIRVPIAGTEDSIREITAKTLELCHRAFYTPANAMLCVIGDVSAAEVLDWTERYLTAPAGEKARSHYGKVEGKTPVRQRTEDAMEVAMPTFMAGFKDVPPLPGRPSMKKEFVGDLTADLLLGASAPLYSRLYEEGLIESSFSAGYEGMKGVSLFTFGGDSRQPDAVVERVLQETRRIQKEGIDPELFGRLKKATVGRKLRELDSFESTCFRMCAYFFEGSEYYDFYDVMQSVTQEDVQAYIAACLRPEQMALSVIRPQKEEE